jgi:His/Glu/Gln/Arg/opine family amino acid ABC transporter permease subunit
MDFSVVAENAPALVRGGLVTVQLTAIVCFLSVLGALPLAVLRDSRHRALAGASAAYSWIMRATPVLVLLYAVYYGLPSVGLVIDPLPAAILCLTASGIGYNMEYFRAGFRAVEPHQRNAARALGMSERRVLFRIVLPQAMPVVIPPLFSNLTNLLKGSALVSLITVSDLTAEASTIISVTYRPAEILLTVAAGYLLMNSMLIAVQAGLERMFRIG